MHHIAMPETVTSGPSGSRRDLLRFGGAAALGATAAGALTVASALPAAAATLIPVYLPAGPTRSYDSRAPGAGGKIYGDQVRTLTSTPPAEVLAYTFNVTVTETSGAGWLALYPGDIAWPGTSSINWFGPGQNLANNAYTGFAAANGAINIRCGGPSTHFILDMVAALVLVDMTTLPTTFAFAGPGSPAGVSDLGERLAGTRWAFAGDRPV